MRTGFPCNESRFFPVGIDLQGNPVSYTGFGFAVKSLFPEILILQKFNAIGGKVLKPKKISLQSQEENEAFFNF